MYPNSQRSFFLPRQQQIWKVIECLGKYAYDPQDHSDYSPNGHNYPVHEMIRFPTGEYTEGAPNHFGPVVNIVELGVFGSMTTHVVTACRVLKYDPLKRAIDCIYEIPNGFIVTGKIAGDQDDHRYAVVEKEKGGFVGILYLRSDEWTLVTAETAEEVSLSGFTAVHFAPAQQEIEPSLITLADYHGTILQFLFDEPCISLRIKKIPYENVPLLKNSLSQ